MTERERERDEPGNNTATRLVSLSVRYLIALFKPAFHLLLLKKTQLYKRCKWTFDLTIHNLIGILEMSQTPSFGYQSAVVTGVQS